MARSFLLLLFSILLTTGHATAQQEADTLYNMLDIEEVTVIGNRVAKEVIPVQTLSGESLQRLSTHSIADAARYFSGVQIKDYGGVGGVKTINIRSLGSQHVGVFYDGIELGNSQNGIVDLGRFSLDNMEAMSIYNGQKSAIFQSAKDYASASSIYMTSRRPQFDSDKSSNINIGVKGGSFKSINPSILWEQKLSKTVSSSISAEYLYSSGEYPFTYAKQNGYDTTEMRENGDIRYLRTEAALFGSFKGGGQWQAKAYLYNSERGYPGAVVREEPGVFKNADRQWDNNVFIQAIANKNFSSLYSLKVSAKYANDYLHYLSDPNLNTATMPIDNTYRQQESYCSIVNLFSLASWASVSLASDFQFNTLDADMVSFVYPERYMSLNSLAASVDYNNLKLQGSMLYTYVKDRTKIASANADDFSKLTPTLIASYSLNRELSLRAFYKRVFRMPTLNDLYYTFIGNVDLSPEYTNQYNIGGTYSHKFKSGALTALELQTDIYYNEVEDKIISMPTSNQFRWTMINLGYVEVRGVDTAIETLWAIGDITASTRVNYTYQKSQDFTDSSSDYYGGQIPYIPLHSGSAIVTIDYMEWAFNYSFIYTGERYESVANIPENYSQPWYTSDISISRDISLKSCELRLTAEVNNLLNQQYEVVQCYPMPGINYKLKLNILL